MQRKTVIRAGVVTALSAGVLATGLVTAPVANATTNTTTEVVNPTPAWTHTISDGGKPIWFGSPGVGNLDGSGPAVIIGLESGSIYAYDVANGASVAGWPYHQSYQIQSTPAVGIVKGQPEVFVGVGTSSAPSKGGYLALKANGTKAWYLTPDGDMSSMAFGPIQTATDVVGASMSQHQYAINAATGVKLRGFPWFEADTNFSSPALADLTGSGHDQIIEGGDSTKGIAYGHQYQNGGHIRILSSTGMSGHAYPEQALRCEYNSNQVIQSSPAVGHFLSGGKMGIVVGTGDFYGNVSENHRIIAIDTSCHRAWSKALDGSTHPSPAIADLNGDGTLDVLAASVSGDIWALKGSNGVTMWKTQLPSGGEQGSPTTFTVPGQNYQDVVIAGTRGLFILDGRTGAILQTINPGMMMRNSATITADPDGSIGITVAGQGPASNTTISHYIVEGTSGVTSVDGFGAWPMFHQNPALTGLAPDPTD